MKTSNWWDTHQTYDYDSIMHYPGVGGSILRKDTGAEVWPRSYDWNSRRATSQGGWKYHNSNILITY